MPETRPPPLLPRIPQVPDAHIEALHERFEFDSGMSADYLRSDLEQAVTFYWSYTPSETAKQKSQRLWKIYQLTTELHAALGINGVDFPDVEPVGIRRPLLELRDRAAELAKRYGRMPPERGRQPQHGLDSFICWLQHTYYLGTGRTDLYTSTTTKRGRERGLLPFTSAVADLYGIDVSDDSIKKAIKRLKRKGELQKWRVGRKSP